MPYHHHFLVVTFAAQGHINPARQLARRLTRSTFSTLVTLAIPTTAFHRMFPSSTTDVEEEAGGLISYTHFTDGEEKDLENRWRCIKESLSHLVLDLETRGRKVTCIFYALLLAPAVHVAREHGIPSFLFWIQPAAVFAIYHRYFHGNADLIAAHENDPTFTFTLPGLPSLQIRDLPSFLTKNSLEENPYAFIYSMFEDMFQTLDRESTGSNIRILVNTFQELEGDVLSAVDGVEMIPIGPLVQCQSDAKKALGGDLFMEDSKGYIEWLDSKEERSVVYVSFGSVAKLGRQQVEKIWRGLVESGRPYLWVLRQDNEVGEGEVLFQGGGEKGMVVEWCSQVRVLNHRSIGCFVTHCGWNSTLESLVCGVPMVMVPQWADQATNARLAEGEWGVGVRAELSSEEGVVVEGRELRRCMDLVMRDGEKIRMRAALWRDKAMEAVCEGGSSIQNLEAFVQEL